MKTKLMAMCVTAAVTVCAQVASANSYTLLSHVGDDSYIMPSIAYDSASGQYNVTFIEARNYHIFGGPGGFGWVGTLYAGTMVEQSPGNFTLTKDDCTGLGPVLVGTDNPGGYYHPGDPHHHWHNPRHRMIGFARPYRRGNMIAWTHFGCAPIVEYYDFSTSTHGCVFTGSTVHGPGWGRAVNARVSGKAISYWLYTLHPDAGIPGWHMKIANTDDPAGDQIMIDEFTPEADTYPHWGKFVQFARSGDIYAESSAEGRVVLTMTMPGWGGDPYAPRGVFWGRYNFVDGAATINTEPIWEGPPDMHIASIVMSEKYVVWQEGGEPLPPPGAPDPEWINYYERLADFPFSYLTAANWVPEQGPSEEYPEGQEEHYQLIDFGGEALMTQEPALFGQYLVYTDIDAKRILMVDLANLEEDPENEWDWKYQVLVEIEDGELGYPAVWVDQNTGRYVVLYQSSGSPDDLMVATNIPEPATIALLAVGGAFALLRRRRP